MNIINKVYHAARINRIVNRITAGYISDDDLYDIIGSGGSRKLVAATSILAEGHYEGWTSESSDVTAKHLRMALKSFSKKPATVGRLDALMICVVIARMRLVSGRVCDEFTAQTKALEEMVNANQHIYESSDFGNE